ncbi:hypothetical protein PoB_005012800 [Plakobranchus ocellatus]|uniref:Uncharacterized protein n=1 Tax=Plakobranchus ocellatus TaxID=259542 RepID=A0AAV4BXU2_9GAST|nr:hypothetical protein PoB_005012800 [Plakobranchus ocellatus]
MAVLYGPEQCQCSKYPFGNLQMPRQTSNAAETRTWSSPQNCPVLSETVITRGQRLAGTCRFEHAAGEGL